MEKGHEDWLIRGCFVEVSWGTDWWQATAKRIKADGGMPNVCKGHILVSYVGGTEEDDEWIAIASGRLRKPQEDFEVEPEAPPAQKDAGVPKKKLKPKIGPGGPGLPGSKGADVRHDVRHDAGSADERDEKKRDSLGKSIVVSDARWLALGDEVVELLRDGPVAEGTILDRIGTRETKRKKKQMALQRLVDGDFIVRQGAGTLGDPHRYFVPDDMYEEGSIVAWVNPNAQLAHRLHLQSQGQTSQAGLAGRMLLQAQAPQQVN